MMHLPLAIGLGVVAAMVVRRLVLRFAYGERGFRRGRFGVGRSFWLRRVFTRLDTTPGQEREIRGALEDLQKTARGAKESLKGSREGLARAIRGDVFDDLAIGEAREKADAVAFQVKEAFEAALRRVHAVLDANQRERLAELLEKGRRGGGHPYRA